MMKSILVAALMCGAAFPAFAETMQTTCHRNLIQILFNQDCQFSHGMVQTKHTFSLIRSEVAHCRLLGIAPL